MAINWRCFCHRGLLGGEPEVRFELLGYERRSVKEKNNVGNSDSNVYWYGSEFDYSNVHTAYRFIKERANSN